MSYLVLARKSRPGIFDEVVGQRTVVRTLQNALAAHRVPHGLIFSGIRGTGKTTLARIMAKALNCEQGPTPTPCNTCRSCREIGAGTSVDLHEIDGASNRGIQEIRDLKEKIRFMPTSARFKIIIIDEVHMLTTEAFNALLKTLEEPPEHVYFMFATTELHKVPVTILSRCQRYELQRVSHKDLAEHFTRLAEAEGVHIEPAAVHLIVREASGSVRDGLSLLDQVFSYCGDQVSAEETAEVLGLVSHQVIAELGEVLLEGDLGRALELLAQVYEYGMNIKRFGNELLSWFRSLVLCALTASPEQYLDLPEEDLARLSGTVKKYSLQTIVALFNLLLEGLEKANYSSQPRLAVELAFIRAVQVGDVQPVTELLERLDQVLAGVSLSDQLAALQPEQKTKKNIPEKGQQEVRARTDEVPDPDPVQPAEDSPVPRNPPIPEEGEGKGQDNEGQSTGKMVERQEVSVPPEREQPSPDGEAVTDPAAGKDVRKHWPEFLEYVHERKAWMAATLQRSSSVKVDGEHLIIGFDDSADCRLLKNREHITPLTEYALDFFQKNFTITFQVPESGACDIAPGDAEHPREERKALSREPLVLTALDVFNGRLGDIRVGPRFRTPLVEGDMDDNAGDGTGNRES